jgi:hypothetical protein
MSTQSLELVIVLLDSPQHTTTEHTTTDRQMFHIPVTEIPRWIFITLHREELHGVNVWLQSRSLPAPFFCALVLRVSA